MQGDWLALATRIKMGASAFGPSSSNSGALPHGLASRICGWGEGLADPLI